MSYRSRRLQLYEDKSAMLGLSPTLELVDLQNTQSEDDAETNLLAHLHLQTPENGEGDVR